MEFMAKDVVSRVIQKCSLLLIQEPAALVGVEEQLKFIEKDLKSTRIHGHYSFIKVLMEIAYDVEDVMDDLILKQAVQEKKKGFLRRFVLSHTLHFLHLTRVFFLGIYCIFESLLEIYFGGITWIRS